MIIWIPSRKTVCIYTMIISIFTPIRSTAQLTTSLERCDNSPYQTTKIDSYTSRYFYKCEGIEDGYADNSTNIQNQRTCNYTKIVEYNTFSHIKRETIESGKCVEKDFEEEKEEPVAMPNGWHPPLLYNSDGLGIEKYLPSSTPEREVITAPRKETTQTNYQDPNLAEYCRNTYTQETSQNIFYSESSFIFRYPKCQHLIPHLRTIITPQLLQYCISQYKNLSKYYSDFDSLNLGFTYRHPECSHALSSIKDQILKENQDLKPQPAIKESNQKNPKQTKGKHVEANRSPTSNKKESTQKTSSANANLEYCVNQYRKLSKNGSDINYFSSVYPECSHALSSIKDQILKENQDLKPQPVTKELDQKNSKPTKEKYAETNNVLTPAAKEMRDKNYKQIDSKNKDKKK